MRIGIVRTASSPCRCAESLINGLKALSHEFVVVDSEEIGIQATALAKDCDLVIDHTDTFQSKGFLRAMVRALLEDSGASVVGSDARACFVADNKAAAKARLSREGIPVPPGMVVQSQIRKISSWLKPPLILKPSFEHMSRGIRVVYTVQEACDEANRMLESLRQPILVESFIPGRELAVSLIDSPEGLQMLPVLEWDIGSGRSDVLSEEFKLLDPEDERHQTRKAKLPDDLNRELEALARRAYEILGLRDYARLDVRLSTGGCFYFLEANTTPSLEPLEALAVSAQWAGLDYTALVDRLLSTAMRRAARNKAVKTACCTIPLPTGSIEISSAEDSPPPPDSSIELARLLDVKPGDRVLDLGCGSGLLSVAAAKLGAAHVTGIDLDSTALNAAVENAERNNVGERINYCAGSWYDALSQAALSSGRRDRYDVIIATPPQTPALRPFGPKYGGADGAANLLKILNGVLDYIKPECGRLWIMAISMANPRRIHQRLQELFEEVTLVHQSERIFTAEEYEAMQPGLFQYFCSLRSSGVSEFVEVEKGRYAFRNLFMRAARPRHL